MPYKNVQDTISDDEDDDDELFSYLQTAHTVKHVKTEPIKSCHDDNDVISSCGKISPKSDYKSNEPDRLLKSSSYKNHRQSHQCVPHKRNVKYRKQSGRTSYAQRNSEDFVPEEGRMNHLSSDILNGIQCNNNKETNVDEFEIVNARKTDTKQNVNFDKSLVIHADIKKQASCDIDGLTQHFDHDPDRKAVVNSICTPENGNKAGNSNRGNDMLQSNAEHESCQTEFSSLDNKYYLINERDWMSLFSSLQMNKQEYPLVGFDLPNTQICPIINDPKRNHETCANVTDAMPGLESRTDYTNFKGSLPDATETETPVKQTESGPQNVEVVYVTIEDEKLKCDINNSPVKNIVVRSPRRCNSKLNCTKHSEGVHSCNNNTTVGDGSVCSASALDRYSEHDFHSRFVRINNKLTRVLHLKDQSSTEKVQTKPDDLVEENFPDVDGHSENGHETAFFIDLDNWHETHGENDSDLKIYPIIIQDDSYTFLQDSSSVEQYIARPLNHSEECTTVDEPASELSELAGCHTLHMNQRLSNSQRSQHSDKIVSNRSPLKKITLSPCRLVRSPRKSVCQTKKEVMNSSAEIIKNLWKNFKSDDGRQRLPGAVNFEDAVESSVNLSESPTIKDTCCIESDGDGDSDNEDDMLFRYLKRNKMKNAADASSSVYSYEESSSPVGSSLYVQTSESNDHKFEPNKLVIKCMDCEIKKGANKSEIHECNDALHEKLEGDDDSDKSKAKCSDEKRMRKDVNSNAEVYSPSENMAVDNEGSLNYAKKKERRKLSADLLISEEKTEQSDNKKRKVRGNKTNVKKAKLSMTAVSKISDGEKTKEFDNEMALCVGSVCNELETSESKRSDENNSGTGTSSHSLWTSCETKNSRNKKKKLKTDKVESGNFNEYEEKINGKDYVDVSDKMNRKRIEKKSAGCKYKKKKVVTDICKGQKNLNFKGRGSKKVGKKDSDRNAFKVNDEKKVKRKIKSKKAVKTKQGVVCPSTELEDLTKWSKIKSSKVEFLEHLFHIKLKEAVEPDEKLLDPLAVTEDLAVKNSGYQDTSIDFESLEKNCNFGVPIKCAEKVIGKVAQRKECINDAETHDKIEDTTRPSTNINAAKDAKKDILTSELVNNVWPRSGNDLPKFESVKLDMIKSKMDAVENDIEIQSDNDRVPTKKLKSDNLVQVTESVDANFLYTCSKIVSRTGRKLKYSKKKDIQMQLNNTNQNSCKRQGSKRSHQKLHEVSTIPESDRRHQRIKSLKQLRSKSKTVYKRKAEIWKEQLQDEAFKFNFDKDLHKTYRPLNVKEMIRKILIPHSEGRKNAKDMKKHRKRKVPRIASKTARYTSRLKVTPECDDAWFSDSGPSGSFPAFKFATANHGMHTPLQVSEEKPLS